MKTKTAVIILVSLTIALIAVLETTRMSSAQPSTNSVSDSLLTNDTVPFTITNVRTHWSIEYPEQIQFNFTVAEKPLLITYSLDNQANTVVSGNFTLTSLTNGSHNVTLYVTDKSGNTVYNTYTAKLQEQSKTPTFSSNLLIAAILGMLSIFIAMSVLLFRRHRKTSNLTQ